MTAAAIVRVGVPVHEVQAPLRRHLARPLRLHAPGSPPARGLDAELAEDAQRAIGVLLARVPRELGVAEVLVAVEADGVPLGEDPLDQVRVVGRAGAEHEERGLRLSGGQRVEHLRRASRVRAIVERQVERAHPPLPPRQEPAGKPFSGGRSHSVTRSGCIVSLTAAWSCSASASRSTSSRSCAENASSVRAAS